jgi:hypothetical protein
MNLNTLLKSTAFFPAAQEKELQLVVKVNIDNSEVRHVGAFYTL